jgi:hypothetical protein
MGGAAMKTEVPPSVVPMVGLSLFAMLAILLSFAAMYKATPW